MNTIIILFAILVHKKFQIVYNVLMILIAINVILVILYKIDILKLMKQFK